MRPCRTADLTCAGLRGFGLQSGPRRHEASRGFGRCFATFGLPEQQLHRSLDLFDAHRLPRSSLKFRGALELL